MMSTDQISVAATEIKLILHVFINQDLTEIKLIGNDEQSTYCHIP